MTTNITISLELCGSVRCGTIYFSSKMDDKVINLPYQWSVNARNVNSFDRIVWVVSIAIVIPVKLDCFVALQTKLTILILSSFSLFSLIVTNKSIRNRMFGWNCGCTRHNSKESECTFIFHWILIGDSANALFFLHTFRLSGEALAERTKSRHTQANASKWLCVQCAWAWAWMCVALTFRYLGFCAFRNSSPSQQNHRDQLKMKKSTEFITLSVCVCAHSAGHVLGLMRVQSGHCRIARAHAHTINSKVETHRI